jgi:hypothetical protein
MAKPANIEGYDDQITSDCERVLVTLLRGLGPWKDSVFLIGGLVPRYLVKDRPPLVPAHAGTLDVDIVVDLQILADTQAYQTLEENFKKMGFERAENGKGQKQSWRWQTHTEHGAVMLIELLADAPDIAGGRVQELPTNGTISAMNIPHSSIVFDMHDVVEVTVDLVGGGGVATEKIRYANLVAFTCLKAIAYDQRYERKDAHDLVYCVEHASGGMEATTVAFRKELAGKHGAVVDCALGILSGRFAGDERTEGYRKDGPVSVAQFELGNAEGDDLRESRLLRQREACDLIEQLLKKVRG